MRFLTHEMELREEGRKQGIEESRAEGKISEAITIYHEELNLAPDQIVDRIMPRFSLNRDSAERYVEDTLSLQAAK